MDSAGTFRKHRVWRLYDMGDPNISVRVRSTVGGLEERTPKPGALPPRLAQPVACRCARRRGYRRRSVMGGCHGVAFLSVRCRVPRVGPPAGAGDPARDADLRTKPPRRHLTRRVPPLPDGAGSAARRRWRSEGSDRSRRPRSRPWNGAHRRRSPNCAARCGR